MVFFLLYVCRAPTSHLSSLKSDGNAAPECLSSLVRVCLCITVVCSFVLTVMSLLVEGIRVSSLVFAPTQRTVLSQTFYNSLPRRSDRILFTTNVAPYGTCSTVLRCDVSSSADFDVVLGHDWASLLRDHLLTLGHRLSSNLDTWQLFLTALTNGMTSYPKPLFIGQ
jgi:hypothetical protein